MNLEWTKIIQSKNPWEPNYYGCFCSINGCVLFLYEEWNELCALPQNKEFADVIYTAPIGTSLALPYEWILVKEDDTAFLFFAQNRAINLSEMVVDDNLTNTVLSAYRAQIKPKSYYEEWPFSFGEYCISHKGYSGYVCTKNGTKVWEFKGQAYLYTDIYRWNNRVYFGTAGKGGYVYILDLENGTQVAKIKTGGTTAIVESANLCYFLSNDKGAKLLCMDLQNGDIIQETVLPGKVSINSRLQLIDSHIHAITFEYKGDSMKNAIWNCISI